MREAGVPVRLVCFHHFDEIHLAAISGTVDEVFGAFTTPSPRGAISAKKMLCFRVDGEQTAGFELQTVGPIVEIAMLRLNHRLLLPSLAAESMVAKRLQQLASPETAWSLAHTLAKKELLLVVSHRESLLECERVINALRTMRLFQGSDAPAFDLVATWPCFRPAKGQDMYTGTFQPLREEVLEDIRGLRVVGSCQRALDGRYSCTSNLNDNLHSELLKDDGDRTKRPLVGSDNDRQVGRLPQAKRLFSEVQELRTQCDCSCCSVYLIRSKERVASDRFLLHNGQAMAEEEQDLPEYADIDLDIIKRTPGSERFGEQLEAVRDRIVQALRNPLIAPEFEDLMPALARFAAVERMYHILGDAKQMQMFRDVGDFEVAVNCRGFAKRLAWFLRRAVDDRVRQDVCGESHHLGSAMLGASGISRLAAVGTYAIKKTLAAYGMPWEGLCVNGAYSLSER